MHIYRSESVGLRIHAPDGKWIVFEDYVARNVTDAQHEFLQGHPRYRAVLEYLGTDPVKAADRLVRVAQQRVDDSGAPAWAQTTENALRQDSVEGAVRALAGSKKLADVVGQSPAHGGFSTADLGAKVVNPKAAPPKGKFAKGTPMGAAAKAQHAAAEGSEADKPMVPPPPRVDQIEDPNQDPDLISKAMMPLENEQLIALSLLNLGFPAGTKPEDACEALELKPNLPPERLVVELKKRIEDGWQYQPADSEPETELPQPTLSEISRSNKGQLVDLCEAHGLDTKGTVLQLRNRLRAHVGE